VLAGDIFGTTPIWRSLLAFKVIYYAAVLANPRRAWQARKMRRMNIQPVIDEAGASA
jgi:hypothetical protein